MAAVAIPATEGSHRRDRVRYWRRILGINALATVVVATADGAFGGGVPFQDAAGTVAAAFIFCSCIGGLCGLILPYLWPALSAVRFPLNWVGIGGVLLGINGAGCLLAMVVLIAVGLAALPARDGFAVWFWENYRIGAFFTLVFGIGGIVYQTLSLQLEDTTEALVRKEREEERARQAATEARLSSLESRVRPHFLFNTLNSISALVHEEPDRAERLIEHLAALLRSSLDASERLTIPLTEELRLVRDYLDIERARFGDRVRYTIDVPASLETASVPPFSIQPLVENAVKYAVAPRSAGAGIRVTARRDEDTLSILVSDDGPGAVDMELRPGHGLHTLHARLEALFGARATLVITRDNGWTVVTMTLPLSTLVPTPA